MNSTNQYGRWTPFIAITIFSLLVIFSLFNIQYRSKKYHAQLFAQDLAQLVTVFNQIDNECIIIDFDYQKNIINFLTIKNFVGSEVGSMNLSYPDKWQGPYLDDNPTMQEKEYMVVRTNKGHFITPGDGVELPNGKRIGVDIMLDEDADIAALMADDNALRYNGKALAIPLNIGAQRCPGGSCATDMFRDYGTAVFVAKDRYFVG